MRIYDTPVPRNKWERLPRVCLVFYLLAAISAALYFAFTVHAGFADWFNLHISRWGRRILAYLTGWFPFSLAEWLILLLPLIAILLIVLAVRHYSHSAKAAFCFIGRIAAFLCLIAVLFVWCFAPGYYGSTLDRKLGLERTKVSAEELYRTALILTEELTALSDGLIMNAEGASVMPYSYTEMNGKLMDAYRDWTADRTFPDHFRSRVKPVMLSEAMSYTHITGVYSFFTGEANVNVAFPDYTIPFTAAHELAHQRGVAREDEANFVAFLVCLHAEDPYIRYSGLLNVYEYVSSALWSADRDLYRAVNSLLPEKVIREEVAYAAFFEKYKDNTAAKISDATNNVYLQSQGAKEGSRSYNMVVDLAVAYYRPQFA